MSTWKVSKHVPATRSSCTALVPLQLLPKKETQIVSKNIQLRNTFRGNLTNIDGFKLSSCNSIWKHQENVYILQVYKHWTFNLTKKDSDDKKKISNSDIWRIATLTHNVRSLILRGSFLDDIPNLTKPARGFCIKTMILYENFAKQSSEKSNTYKKMRFTIVLWKKGFRWF